MSETAWDVENDEITLKTKPLQKRTAHVIEQYVDSLQRGKLLTRLIIAYAAFEIFLLVFCVLESLSLWLGVSLLGSDLFSVLFAITSTMTVLPSPLVVIALWKYKKWGVVLLYWTIFFFWLQVQTMFAASYFGALLAVFPSILIFVYGFVWSIALKKKWHLFQWK